MRTSAIILAAGASTRFGSPKQLHAIDGVPMLERVVRATRPAVNGELVVVLGSNAAAVRAGCDLTGATLVENPDWPRGQGSSLRAGLAATAACDCTLIVLGDLPWLQDAAFTRVIAALEANPDADAARATAAGVPGHPIALGPRARELAAGAPDDGLRLLLRELSVIEVDCAGLGVSEDVDEPAVSRRRPQASAQRDRAGRPTGGADERQR